MTPAPMEVTPDQPMSPPASAVAAATGGWLSWLPPYLLALAFIGPFSFRVVSETDLGWLLAIGRVISQSGIPHRNTLCWTAPDEPWYATSWLYDWVTYQLASHTGVLGVQLFMFSVVALTLAGALACAVRLEAKAGPWAVPVLALLLVPRVSERPFVVSWAVLSWTFWFCVPDPGDPSSRWDRSFRRRLWCLPLIALGSNFHSGAIFPSVLLAIFCAEAFLLSGYRLRELLLSGAGFLALIANPGGLFNVTSVFWHVNTRSLVSIAEFAAPTLRRGYIFFILAAVVIVLAWLLRRRSAALLGVSLVFAAFGAWGSRFIYDFEILAIPVLAFGFGAVARRGGRRLAALIIALVIGGLIVNRWEWTDFLQMGARWDEQRLPVRAAAFVREEHLEGRMYNGYEEGGYLEWAVPELRWFQDARLQAFPSDFFRAATAVEHSPEAFRKWLRGLDVEWAVATRMKRELSGRNMFDAPDWAVVYWDEVSQVVVRRDVPREAALIDRLGYRHFAPSAELLKEIATASPAGIAEWEAELDRFERTTQRFPSAMLARCAIAMRRGLRGDACEAASQREGSDKWRSAVDAARTIPALR